MGRVTAGMIAGAMEQGGDTVQAMGATAVAVSDENDDEDVEGWS